jgi:glycosyltransferase involved in cell wall biosynthesis
MALTFTVIVCAHNEERYLPACLHSLLAQTRCPDEILVVNNASTDATGAVAEAIPRVRVVDEPRKGLVVAREAGRLASTGDVLVYIDADCRAPLRWLEHVERRFAHDPDLIALSGPYRFYDWDWWGRLLIRAYDFTLAPATQILVKHVLRIGTIFYGGNFAVRRTSLDRIGFDLSIEFHGEDTNLGRRLFALGKGRVPPLRAQLHLRGAAPSATRHVTHRCEDLIRFNRGLPEPSRIAHAFLTRPA